MNIHIISELNTGEIEINHLGEVRARKIIRKIGLDL